MKDKSFKRWSSDEDRILRDLINSDCDTITIANALGRTKTSIATRKNTLGIERRIQNSPRKRIKHGSFLH